jgi:hypothetical protein
VGLGLVAGVDAVQQVVEAGAGEVPAEWPGDGVVAGLERGQAVADLAEAGEVVRADDTFSYVDATLAGATTLKLCRLRYVGSAHQWQFAIYRASHDDYDESIFPTGLPIGTCQDALDTACGLYLNDPTAWA